MKECIECKIKLKADEMLRDLCNDCSGGNTAKEEIIGELTVIDQAVLKIRKILEER